MYLVNFTICRSFYRAKRAFMVLNAECLRPELDGQCASAMSVQILVPGKNPTELVPNWFKWFDFLNQNFETWFNPTDFKKKDSE